MYLDSDGGMINPFYDWLQSPEERKLLGSKFSHFDFTVIDDLRNGDGTFLDFGKQGENNQAEKKINWVKNL